MKFILNLFLAIATLYLSIALYFGVAYLLPRPYSFFNLIFALLVIYLLVTESGRVIWISFVVNFIIELFSSSALFGIGLFSSTIALIISYWFFKYVFVNRSWYIGAVLTLITIFIYRLVYILLLYFSKFFGLNIDFIFYSLLYNLFWEAVTTTTFVGIIFLFIYYFWLKPGHPIIKSGSAFPL